MRLHVREARRAKRFVLLSCDNVLHVCGQWKARSGDKRMSDYVNREMWDLVIFDEVQHAPARTIQPLVRRLRARRKRALLDRWFACT